MTLDLQTASATGAIALGAAQMLALLLSCAICLGIVTWTAGALYFDVGRASRLAGLLVLFWVAAVIGVFILWQPVWKPFLLMIVFWSVFLLWWFSQQPSNERDWNPNCSTPARFDLDGDLITIENVRNTEYRTLDDFTSRYETRTYRLSHLSGVDVAITYWGSSWLCHPLLIFTFDDQAGEENRICFSIEVRYRVGQQYSFLRSLYRQQEIMYVVSDERDAILRRSKFSENHDVYLYRLFGEAEEIRKVFLEYVASTNGLTDNPRWYHGLTTNCTVSIYRQRTRQVDWDWRWLFNGKLDEMLYERERLDARLPFEELKQNSLVNEIANRAPSNDFGNFIRRELPAYQQESSS